MSATQRLVNAVFSRTFEAMANSFLKETRRHRQVAQKTLDEILSANGNTEWGRAHGLNGPDRLENFKALPVTTYQDYIPYIERAANGEPGVLTSDPVTYFAVSSGTTGPQKLIPVTRRQTRAIMSTMMIPMGLAMRDGMLGPVTGRWLQIMTEQINGTTPGGIPKGAATSGGMDKMAPMFKLIWTSPMPVIKIQDQVAARYLHLLYALREERLWTLVSFFPSTLLSTLRNLHERADELLKDVAEGTITPKLDLPVALRHELAGQLRPMPERARQLSRLLEQGRFTVRDIWPHVGVVLTAGSGTFRFYIDQLEPYLGGVKAFSPVYASSEATIGIGFSHKQPGYLVAPSAAYHEFLPLSDAENPEARPLPSDQLKVGECYEVVLTTFAGLTRYRLGDVVRMLGYHNETPIVEFVERVGRVINLDGEKTSEARIAQAFEAACKELGAPVMDYVVSTDASRNPARYILLMEEIQPGTADVRALLRRFEAHLQEVAPSYGRYRQMGRIGPMVAMLLKPGAFERYRERRVRAGASAAQVKVPHALPDPRVAQEQFYHEELTRIGEEG